MGSGVRARLTPVALRRWMTLAAIVACGFFALSISRQTGLGYMTDSFEFYSLDLCNGELHLRCGTSLPSGTRPPMDCGLRLINGFYGGECSFAWRPYHRESMGSRDGFDEIAVPLWQPATASLILLGYVHGLIGGLRRVDRSRCRVCGVDLAGCPPGEHCPSCGTRPSSRAGMGCRACGYDLRGLSRGWGGRCKCPECGTTTLRPAR